MKTHTNENNQIILEEVYEPLILKTEEGNELQICMRDDTFELYFNEQHFRCDLDHSEIVNINESSFSDEKTIKNNEFTEAEQACVDIYLNVPHWKCALNSITFESAWKMGKKLYYGEE